MRTSAPARPSRHGGRGPRSTIVAGSPQAAASIASTSATARSARPGPPRRSGRRPSDPSAARRPGTASVLPPQIWVARRIESTRLTRASPSAPGPSTCSPSRIWASLISHSHPSTCRMKSSNSSSCGRSSRPRSWSHLRGLDQRPDLRPDRRELGRVHRRDVGVLVEQLLRAARCRRTTLGARHRRDQVVDDRGVRTALGLRPLARVVDQERVDQRHVPDRGVGPAARGQARRSCRAATPSSRACRGVRRRRRRTRSRASDRPRCSGARAACRGRGRSPPGSHRTRGAAGSG